MIYDEKKKTTKQQQQQQNPRDCMVVGYGAHAIGISFDKNCQKQITLLIALSLIKLVILKPKLKSIIIIMKS